MQKYFNTVINESGAKLVGALVRVLLSSGQLPTIYSDNGVTPATNPLVTDANGYFEFWAADETYTLTVTYNNRIVKVLSGVTLGAGAVDPQTLQARNDAIAAAASVTNRFYAGTYPSDPATRPDGTAIQQGDIYFNSSVNAHKAFAGSSWVAFDINAVALAASGGSSLVGFQQSGTGAVPRSSQDKMRETVSFWDFLSDLEKADALTGSPSLDHTASMQKAMDAAAPGQTIIGRADATFSFTNLVSTKPLSLDFRGAALKVDPTTSGANGNPAIWFKGALGSTFNLNNITAGAASVTCSTSSDAGNFAAGDYAWVTDSTIYSPSDSAGSTYSGLGELVQVKSVSAGVVTLMWPIEQTYATSPAIAKATMLAAPAVRNIGNCVEVDPGIAYSGALSGNCPHIIHFQYCDRPSVEACRFTGWSVHAVNADRCIKPMVRALCKFDRPYRVSPGLGYAVRFGQCRGGVCEGGVSYSCRHHFDHTNSFDVQSRNNTAFDIQQVAFGGHGMNSRRYTSTDDQCIGSGTGWAMGNATFGADYEFRFVNPVYRGTGGGVQFYTGSEDLEIVNPDFVTVRGVTMRQGSKRLAVRGGVIDLTQITSLNYGITVDGALTSTVNCDGLDVDGTLFKMPDGIGRAVDHLNTVGRISVRNCRFSGGDRFYNGDYTVTPSAVQLHGNRQVGGNTTFFCNVSGGAPSGPWVATENHCDSYTNAGLRFPETTRLWIAGNFMDRGAGLGSNNNAYICAGTYANILGVAGANLVGNMTLTGTLLDTVRSTGAFTSPMILRGRYLWVDGFDRPRTKATAPTGDTDGNALLFKKLTGTTSASIGTAVTVAHGLGYTPTNVIVSPRGAGSVYQSAAADATNVTIAGTAASIAFDVYVN